MNPKGIEAGLPVIVVTPELVSHGFYIGPSLDGFQGSVEFTQNLGPVVVVGNVDVAGSVNSYLGTELDIRGSLVAGESILVEGMLDVLGNITAGDRLVSMSRISGHDIRSKAGIDSADYIETRANLVSETGDISAHNAIRCGGIIHAAGSITSLQGDIQGHGGIVSVEGIVSAPNGSVITITGALVSAGDVTASGSIVTGLNIDAGGVVTAGLRVLAGITSDKIPTHEEQLIQCERIDGDVAHGIPQLRRRGIAM